MQRTPTQRRIAASTCSLFRCQCIGGCGSLPAGPPRRVMKLPQHVDLCTLTRASCCRSTAWIWRRCCSTPATSWSRRHAFSLEFVPNHSLPWPVAPPAAVAAAAVPCCAARFVIVRSTGIGYYAMLPLPPSAGWPLPGAPAGHAPAARQVRC